MTSRNVEYLREHGPSSLDELPNVEVSPTDRRNGVWKLKLTPGNGANDHTKDQRRAPPAVVYYLKGTHDQETVLEKWLEVNEDIVRHEPHRGLRSRLRDLGRPWHDAIDDVFPA